MDINEQTLTNTPIALMQTPVVLPIEVSTQATIPTPIISAQSTILNLTNSTPTLNASLPQYQIPPTVQSGTSKYTQLLSMIDELGKDIRPTYNANRNCSDRLKRSIQHARGLVRECMAELEKNARQHHN